MEFDHGGASDRFERLKEIALEDAFIFDLIGIKKIAESEKQPAKQIFSRLFLFEIRNIRLYLMRSILF